MPYSHISSKWQAAPLFGIKLLQKLHASLPTHGSQTNFYWSYGFIEPAN